MMLKSILSLTALALGAFGEDDMRSGGPWSTGTCLEEWSGGREGPPYAETTDGCQPPQYGCPAIACDGLSRPWCFAVEGGWFWCNPEEHDDHDGHDHGEEYCDFFYDNARICEDDGLTWCCDRDSSYPKCGDNYGECKNELSKKTAKKLAIGIIIGIVVAIIVVIASIVACCICCRRRGA